MRRRSGAGSNRSRRGRNARHWRRRHRDGRRSSPISSVTRNAMFSTCCCLSGQPECGIRTASMRSVPCSRDTGASRYWSAMAFTRSITASSRAERDLAHTRHRLRRGVESQVRTRFQQAKDVDRRKVVLVIVADEHGVEPVEGRRTGEERALHRFRHALVGPEVVPEERVEHHFGPAIGDQHRGIGQILRGRRARRRGGLVGRAGRLRNLQERHRPWRSRPRRPGQARRRAERGRVSSPSLNITLGPPALPNP